MSIRSLKKKNEIHIGSYAFEMVLVILMVLFSAVMLYPLVNVISISLSSPAMISSGKVTWFPKEITLIGYEIVFGQDTIWRAYWNTIVYAFSSAVFSCFLPPHCLFPDGSGFCTAQTPDNIFTDYNVFQRWYGTHLSCDQEYGTDEHDVGIGTPRCGFSL